MIRTALKFLFLLSAASLTLLSPEHARACATCGGGDPTLTVMGVEKPYQYRARLSLEARVLTYDLGSGDTKKDVEERRITLSAAFAPLPWLFVSAALPLLQREVDFANLEKQSATGVGDFDLRARAYFWQDRPLWPSHLLALQFGMKFPTGPAKRDAANRYLDNEAQLGSGSYDPIFGFVYSYFNDPWSLYVSSVVQWPLNTSDFGLKMGPALRSSATAQWQMQSSLAARLSFDTRFEAKAIYLGQKDHDSGGFIAFVTPQLLWSPFTDFFIQFSFSLPLIDALHGTRSENPIASIALIGDL